MPYIGRSLGDGVRARYIYAATSGQTTFSGNDANGIALAYSDTLYMDVYQNGVLLKPVTDYAATTGTSVVFVTGASADDVVEMIVYDSFAVADTVSAANGGTFSGNMAMGGTLAVTGATTLTGELTQSQTSIDFWRMNAHDSSSGTTITAWERPDDGYYASINGLTVSSGVFSFAKTGLYKFDVCVLAQNVSSADTSFGVAGRVSTNSGGAYDEAAIAYNGSADSGDGNNGASMQFMVNVTDTSTFRVKFTTDSLASGTYIAGDTNRNMTCFSCIKLAPAQ